MKKSEKNNETWWKIENNNEKWLKIEKQWIIGVWKQGDWMSSTSKFLYWLICGYYCGYLLTRQRILQGII